MTKSEEPIIIYATFGDLENARQVARRIIEERLGACVNIIPGAASFYEWEGKIEEQSEMIMVIKSLKGYELSVIGMIEALHSYDEPAIITLPVLGGAVSYLDWASKQVGKV